MFHLLLVHFDTALKALSAICEVLNLKILQLLLLNQPTSCLCSIPFIEIMLAILKIGLAILVANHYLILCALDFLKIILG